MTPILITGQMYSGKDYFASKLINHFLNKNRSVLKTAFAWKIKDYCRKYLGLAKEGILKVPHDIDDVIKLYEAIETDFESLYGSTAGVGLELFHHHILPPYKKILDGEGTYSENIREIMQKLGTEVVRESYNENFWVDYVNNMVVKVKDDVDFMVIADRRFPNENIPGAYCIRVNADLDVRAKRAGYSEDTILEMGKHESEIHVSKLSVDIDIVNNSTCGDFKNTIESLYELLV